MPFIHCMVAGTLTQEQKKIIASEFAETLEKVAGKPKGVTYTVFDEVDRENWAVGDRLLSE